MRSRLLSWILLAFLFLAALWVGYRANRAQSEAMVVVEWSTATEIDTAGFNLYRGDSETGPFEKINPQLIPAEGDPLTGGSYVFTDTLVVSGVTYYYELGDVETNGVEDRHGPIEVAAEGGGRTELVMAIILLASALVGLVLMLVPARSQPGSL